MIRKGQLTIANIAGMVILLFIFGVAWGPITEGLTTAFKGANVSTQIAVVLIPLGLLITFVTMPFTLSAREEERRMRQNLNRPRGMEKR